MHKKRIAICSLLALALGIGTPTAAFACTGIIVGPELTTDGSFYFGRTEDLEINHNKAYVIHEAGYFQPGQTIEDVSYGTDAGYQFTFANPSYRYNGVNDTTPEYGIFDEAGFNEKGLMVDMTVSASANEAVLAQDPLLDGEDGSRVGLTEAILPTVVLATCDTPENAVRFIADELATKGAAEGNSLVVASKSDLWYMEIYTGHQFLAMRYPKDKFSVFPNTFWINGVTLTPGKTTNNYVVSQDGNYIFSKGLFSTAQAAGTFKGDAARNYIEARESYADPEVGPRNASRSASGIKTLNPSAQVDPNGTAFPFLQSAEKKSISLEMVMDATRNRFGNLGNLPGNDTGEEGYYPIGNRNVMEAHVFQIPTAATDSFPGVEYLALGSTLTSPYVPYYLDQTAGFSPAMNTSNEYTSNSVYWTAMDILHMVETNRSKYQPIVNAKLSPVQKEILTATKLSDEGASARTAWNTKAASKAFAAMQSAQTELRTKLFQDGYTSSSERVRKAGLSGGEFRLTVPAGVTDTVWKLSFDSKSKALSIVDAYGESVGVPAGVPFDITIRKATYEKNPGLTLDGQSVRATLQGDVYVWKYSTTVGRYSGKNRQAVAANLSKSFFTNAKTAFIVNSHSPSDAISAANLSQGKAPILYTHGIGLDEVTQTELARLHPQKVVLVGGTGAVSDAVQQTMRTLLPSAQVTRIEGSSRYAVNAQSANEFSPDTNAIVIAPGQNSITAVNAVSFAKNLNAPVFLVSSQEVPREISEQIKRLNKVKQVVIVGNETDVSTAVQSKLDELTGVKSSRLTSQNQFQVSAALAGNISEPRQAIVASGIDPADALVAAPLAQSLNLPLVLSSPDKLDPSVVQYIQATKSIKQAIFVGGPAPLSQSLRAQMQGILN